MGVLIVFLDKATNLADTDGIGKADPYVMFHLEQDNMVFDKSYGKQKSSIKESDLNPVWGETFTFNDLPSLDNMVLHCKIMDKDVLKDDKMGSCKIKLEKMGLGSDPLEMEKVVDNNFFSKDGKIHLRIAYED